MMKAKGRPRRPRATIYTDADGCWRWRIRASNGLILADSGEGYERRPDCWAGLTAAMNAILDGPGV